MKIVNIHYTGLGGLASVVNALVTAPGAEVHEWLMAYYGVATIKPSHIAFCKQRGFCYAVFNPEPRYPWAAWRQLATWLISEQPDAIICHSSTAIPPCSCVSKLLDIPLIAVEHTPNEVKSKTEWLGSLAAMLMADSIVILTDTYGKLLSNRLGPVYNYRKVRKIGNGISTNTFFPSARSKSLTGPICAGMAGRLSATKRQDLLIDISYELGITLEIAGDGDCMASLKQLALAYKEAKVAFCGAIPEADMPAWFRGLNIYFHASNGETFSMAVLQAMASGLPIIASDVSGMDEVLGRDGQCGLLVANTREAWLEAVRTLIDDPELRIQMGMAARRKVEQYFDCGTMLEHYVNLISELRGVYVT